MKHITSLALAIGLSLASLSMHAVAGNSDEPMAHRNAADIAIDADRMYSFIDPETKRITALVVTNDRPSMTISIDQSEDIVYLTTPDRRTANVSITDLANAYAQGDIERRAAFLVSMQRAPRSASYEAAPPCDTPACTGTREDEPTTVASIVLWAVDNVGSSRQMTQAENDTTAQDRTRPIDVDGWQKSNESARLLHSISEFWRLWR